MPEQDLTVLWVSEEPGLYECGAFRLPRRRASAGPRDRFATYAVWVGRLDDFEALARGILADVDKVRAAVAAEPEAAG